MVEARSNQPQQRVDSVLNQQATATTIAGAIKHHSYVASVASSPASVATPLTISARFSSAAASTLVSPSIDRQIWTHDAIGPQLGAASVIVNPKIALDRTAVDTTQTSANADQRGSRYDSTEAQQRLDMSQTAALKRKDHQNVYEAAREGYKRRGTDFDPQGQAGYQVSINGVTYDLDRSSLDTSTQTTFEHQPYHQQRPKPPSHPPQNQFQRP